MTKELDQQLSHLLSSTAEHCQLHERPLFICTGENDAMCCCCSPFIDMSALHVVCNMLKTMQVFLSSHTLCECVGQKAEEISITKGLAQWGPPPHPRGFQLLPAVRCHLLLLLSSALHTASTRHITQSNSSTNPLPSPQPCLSNAAYHPPPAAAGTCGDSAWKSWEEEEEEEEEDECLLMWVKLLWGFATLLKTTTEKSV